MPEIQPTASRHVHNCTKAIKVTQVSSTKLSHQYDTSGFKHDTKICKKNPSVISDAFITLLIMDIQSVDFIQGSNNNKYTSISHWNISLTDSDGVTMFRFVRRMWETVSSHVCGAPAERLKRACYLKHSMPSQ